MIKQKNNTYSGHQLLQEEQRKQLLKICKSLFLIIDLFSSLSGDKGE
jgi:hypothetical protein